jgi:two-component system LytT family response regulator
VSAPAFRAAVADDERVARAGLRALLAADPEIELVAECSSGEDAVAAVRERGPDLLVLDVQMPGMSGLDVLRALGPDAPPAVIFVTAHDDYAVDAFSVRALDYVLKPFSDERFALAVGRAKEQVRRARMEALAQEMLGLLGRPPGAGAGAPGGAAASAAGANGANAAGAASPTAGAVAGAAAGRRERFVVRGGGRVSFVHASEVDWIEADDYYVQLHAGPKSYLLRESLRELEAQLDPRHFVRIHRSAIVRVDRVEALRSTGQGAYAVRLKDGTELKLSRRRRDELQALLSGR